MVTKFCAKKYANLKSYLYHMPCTVIVAGSCLFQNLCLFWKKWKKDQGWPKCNPWAKCSLQAHFTWPAFLVSDGVAYGLPKPGLCFCTTVTAVSCYLSHIPLCLNVLRTNMSMKGVANEWFCFKPFVNVWAMLTCSL